MSWMSVDPSRNSPVVPDTSSAVVRSRTGCPAVVTSGRSTASKEARPGPPRTGLNRTNGTTTAISALTADGGMLSCRTLCGNGTTTGGGGVLAAVDAGVLAGTGSGKVGVAGPPLTEYQVASE